MSADDDFPAICSDGATHWIPRKWLSHVCTKHLAARSKQRASRDASQRAIKKRDAGSRSSRNKLRTKCVFLVFGRAAQPEAPVVLAHPAVDAVPEALVHGDGDAVRAADVEVDEEALVGLVGDALELLHQLAAERDTAVFWGDAQGRDVAVPVCSMSLRLPESCVIYVYGMRVRAEGRWRKVRSAMSSGGRGEDGLP